MKSRKIKERCPLCRSTEIAEVREDNGIDGPGYKSWLKYKYCKECGIMFQPVSEISEDVDD